MSTEIDWRNDEVVVVGWQQAIAVYRGAHGDIVVTQERDAYSEDDDLILIQPSNAMAVARAILRVAGELGIDISQAHPSKDKTAAERQRRHRDKQRDVTEKQRDNDRDIKRDRHAQAPLKVVANER